MKQGWVLKYGSAAVIAAAAIIALSLFANLAYVPSVTETPSTAQGASTATLAVLLTDPPVVPAGTTQLNMTYKDFYIHIIYPNGTEEWVFVDASGTVNLFSIVNMTQTIAVLNIPVNSTIDKVKFTIDGVIAVINGQVYEVTPLSDTFVAKISNGKISQSLSGLLIDFNPTLVQIEATDENDTTVYYYVLVPSARALIVQWLTQAHLKVGTIIKIGENHKVQLERVVEDFSRNLTITSASLMVEGNTTRLSVTLKNEGYIPFAIFGLTLHGEFNTTVKWISKRLAPKVFWQIPRCKLWVQHHPRTIPFRVNGTSLIPLYPIIEKPTPPTPTVIKPGETVTLEFEGVITFYVGWKFDKYPLFTLTPIVGNQYTIRLMGEGFQSYTVTATPP
ncbi:MAG: hypothetical protein QXZ68_03150 [Candidatus Bathyarchaeia archaeon]